MGGAEGGASPPRQAQNRTATASARIFTVISGAKTRRPDRVRPPGGEYQKSYWNPNWKRRASAIVQFGLPKFRFGTGPVGPALKAVSSKQPRLSLLKTLKRSPVTPRLVPPKLGKSLRRRTSTFLNEGPRSNPRRLRWLPVGVGENS